MKTISIETLPKEEFTSHAAELVDDLTVQNFNLRQERQVLWITCAVLFTSLFVF